MPPMGPLIRWGYIERNHVQHTCHCGRATDTVSSISNVLWQNIIINLLFQTQVHMTTRTSYTYSSKKNLQTQKVELERELENESIIMEIIFIL